MIRSIPLMIALVLSACCPPLCLTDEPIVEPVDAWADVELIFARIEADHGGPIDEISIAQLDLADIDGDGEFPLSALGFLVEPQPWSEPFDHPMDLYESLVEQDPSLSEAGKAARLLASNRIEASLEELLAQ